MQPESTSTPKFRVSGRRAVGHYKDETYISPVSSINETFIHKQNDSEIDRQYLESTTNLVENDRASDNEDFQYQNNDRFTDSEKDSDSEEMDSDVEDINETSTLNNKSNSVENQDYDTPTMSSIHPWCMWCIFFMLFVSIGLCFLSIKSPIENKKIKMLNDIQSKFPMQYKDTWIYINSSIFEAKIFNKPSVMVFLYRHDAKDTLNKLLKHTAKYASCVINDDCSIQPISLTAKQLNVPELIKDYGVTISKYGPELQEKKIMIIENFDDISVYVAQAFHSFCDEFSPLVRPSFFIFTIKVDRFEEKELTQVQNILRQKWKELDGDKLEPLLTRISNIVLRVTPEVKI